MKKYKYFTVKTILIICLMLIEINGFTQNNKIEKIEDAVKATLEIDNDFSKVFFILHILNLQNLLKCFSRTTSKIYFTAIKII